MDKIQTTVTLPGIQKTVQQIVDRFHPQKVILFGSYAYGKPTEDSDVDLLVVMETEENPMHMAGLISAAIDHPFPLDILVMTPSRLEEYVNEKAIFETQLVTKGVVLYEAGDNRVLGKQGGAMKSFNWQDLLKGHPLFSSLTAVEITQLLRDEASQERAYPSGSVILSEGEYGDSLFLIGSGSVQVAPRGTADQHLPLAILQAAEFFGEIAVLERRPRSATVTAKEHCTLLEVKGEGFRKLLEAHPDMRAKVRATMSERLGHSSQQ